MSVETSCQPIPQSVELLTGAGLSRADAIALSGCSSLERIRAVVQCARSHGHGSGWIRQCLMKGWWVAPDVCCGTVDDHATMEPAPAQSDLLAEIRSLQRLNDLGLEAAETLTCLALTAFARARDGEERADRLGSELLDAAERIFGESKALRAEAEVLWRRLES